MKHFYFAAFAALLVLAQCQKDSPEGIAVTPEPIDTTPTTPPVFKDTLAVWKNGARWEGSVDAFLHPAAQGSGKRFVLRAVKKVNISITERFYVSDIPCKIGDYTIDDGRTLATLNNGIPQPRFVYVIGDDVGGGYYYPDTLFTGNFMRVLRYDTLSQIVEGAFHFVMNVDKQTGNIPGIPDTISMTNGYFKVKIKQ